MTRTLEAGTRNISASCERRIVPATAHAGFLLSPYVVDTSAFEQLHAGAPGTPVTSIALFEYPATGVLYEPEVRVMFHRLEVGGR